MGDEAAVEQAARAYERDGAAVLRNVVPLPALARLGEAIDRMMNDGTRGYDRGSAKGRFFGDLYTTRYDPAFKRFVVGSGLAEIAGRVMRSREVRFFYDQLLVKEPGTTARTPWHQDLPYWPASGDHVISTWVPVDAANAESGVVSYVQGSHKWHKFFPMQPFAEGASADAEPGESWQDNPIYDRPDGPGLRTLADVRDNPEHYTILSWEVEPGDVIVHHPLAVHGAPGNASRSQRRRALALRWFGDDAHWDDSRPHFMRRFKGQDFPYPELTQGQKIEAPVFPLLWSADRGAVASTT